MPTDALCIASYVRRDHEGYVRRNNIAKIGDAPLEAWHAVGCLFFEALLDWHFGELASCQPTMAEAISLAKELNNMQALAHALWHAGWLAQFERNPAEVERLASDLSELSTRLNFEPFLQRAAVLRGWARSASGNTAEGISWIEEGIGDYRATASNWICLFYWH
jgi:hypothetical protein